MRIELLPGHVRAARRRRELVRRWAAAVTLAAVVGGAAVAATATTVVGPASASAAAATPRAVVEAELERLAAREEATRASLRAVMARLEANRALSDSVDWSALLRGIARATGDGVVLSRVALVRGGGGAHGGGRGAGTEAIRVELSGEGRTPRDVSGFVLALEALGIFDRVALRETRGRAAAGGPVTGFEVRAAVRGDADAAAEGGR